MRLPAGGPHQVRCPLPPLAQAAGFDLRHGLVEHVDLDACRVWLADGADLGYQRLCPRPTRQLHAGTVVALGQPLRLYRSAEIAGGETRKARTAGVRAQRWPAGPSGAARP